MLASSPYQTRRRDGLRSTRPVQANDSSDTDEYSKDVSRAESDDETSSQLTEPNSGLESSGEQKKYPILRRRSLQNSSRKTKTIEPTHNLRPRRVEKPLVLSGSEHKLDAELYRDSDDGDEEPWHCTPRHRIRVRAPSQSIFRRRSERQTNRRIIYSYEEGETVAVKGSPKSATRPLSIRRLNRHKHNRSYSPTRSSSYSPMQKRYSERLLRRSVYHTRASEPGKRYELRERRPACYRYDWNLKDEKAAPNTNRAVSIPTMDPTARPIFNLAVFKQVAGLDEYVQQLKEMIIMPLLHPEVFARFGIIPPRGVIFHGPPGTGKTLLARQLASACSTASRPVAFIFRNGAECLSKWIGEAERNLIALFATAAKSQPAIIFFDEIDGLAPDRGGMNARTDQSHVSLVSTLLSLMDGMDARGNVVIIGATNRIHAIDPALRRPGRFDREFLFSLPEEAARKEILKVHMSGWPNQPSDRFLAALAKETHGYSGADLKAICTEAALAAMRNAIPADSLDISTVSLDDLIITPVDISTAFRKLVPSGKRSASHSTLPLTDQAQSLLADQLSDLKECLQSIFSWNVPSNNAFNLSRHACRLNLRGFFLYWEGSETSIPPLTLSSLLVTALGSIGKIQLIQLDLNSLYIEAGAGGIEVACARLLQQLRNSAPAVMFAPLIDRFWKTSPVTIRDLLVEFWSMLNDNEVLLLVGTISLVDDELEDLYAFFNKLTRWRLYPVNTQNIMLHRLT